MLKKIIIGALSAIVVTAVGISAYNTLASPNLQPLAQSGPTAVETQVQAVAATQGQNQGNGPAWLDGNTGSTAETQGTGTFQDTQARLANPTQSAITNGASQGQGRGYRGGGRNGDNANSSQSGTGIPDPQNGFQEWVSLSGTVSAYAPPNFTLLTSDGQNIAAQLGNLSYVSSLGLELQDGQQVSLTGYYDPSGSLAVGQISLIDSGQTYTLRDDSGRPMWAGGQGR